MSIREFNSQIGSSQKKGAWPQALCELPQEGQQDRKRLLKQSWPIWGGFDYEV